MDRRLSGKLSNFTVNVTATSYSAPTMHKIAVGRAPLVRSRKVEPAGACGVQVVLPDPDVRRAISGGGIGRRFLKGIGRGLASRGVGQHDAGEYSQRVHFVSRRRELQLCRRGLRQLWARFLDPGSDPDPGDIGRNGKRRG